LLCVLNVSKVVLESNPKLVQEHLGGAVAWQRVKGSIFGDQRENTIVFQH
jgi:hypothetical protein